MAAVQDSMGNSTAPFPVYPRIHPTKLEAQEWWAAVENYLNQTDHGWFERGSKPPWLSKQTVLTDMTGLAEVALPASNESAYLNTVRYNLMVRDKQSENDARILSWRWGSVIITLWCSLVS